jgi:hypothetical protein
METVLFKFVMFYSTFPAMLIVDIVQNKPSLLLDVILQNVQILQLFTINIKTESIYKSY